LRDTQKQAEFRTSIVYFPPGVTGGGGSVAELSLAVGAMIIDYRSKSHVTCHSDYLGPSENHVRFISYDAKDGHRSVDGGTPWAV
jgi:hypothetical protein